MATPSHADSRRKYSWWWDSHISPKNSKWLQENLTDMDAKVKAMIKLIEEDADSFARRAEMYYKKRPELMKLVEEFYRAYRALAERYDHATGVIRQAHRTMAEAFPNQFPFILDDSQASSALEAEPSTPKISPPLRAMFSPDDLQKDAFELSPSYSPAIKGNGGVTDESDLATSRKGLKQLNSLFGPVEHGKFTDGRVRKGLNFNEAVEKEQSMQHNENHSLPARALPDSDRVDKSEKVIVKLKESLAKLEAEKEADLVQYQQSLERLSKLESEVSRAQEDSRELSDRAGKAEAEVQALKESLVKLEAEKEASFLQYKQCLDTISTLEKLVSHAQEDVGELNERASKAEIEVQQLKQNLAKTEADRDAALLQCNQSLELISDLRKKLLQAQEEALIYSERAEKAEREVETLKQAIAKLTEENEAAALKYQECLDTIANLECKISFSQEEMQRLNGEIDDGVKKLKDAEERCVLLESSNLSLHTDMEDMVLKMGTQSQELIEKQKELGRLWTCIQEERLRFMEAETAFQTLQLVHSQAQEELRSLASELQNRAQVLREIEAQNQILQDEVQNFKKDNKSLSDLNLSSAISMKEMENVILGLRETKGKLEEEVELRVDQRNALQQEIYCIKEELNAVRKKHQALLEQVDAVGLNPEHVESSVKELQVENLNLKESFQVQRSEKEALLGKLEILEQLIEKNAILESYIFNLSGELEGLRGKLSALEDSYQSLLEEKSVIVDERDSLRSQLQVTAENLGKLSEKNSALENSISDAHDELGSLKAKSKSLELSCQLLTDEKTDLFSEKDALRSHLESTEKKLEVLEKLFKELEEKYSVLEKEKEFSLERVKELQASLDVEKQEHANFVQLSTKQLAGMGSEVRHLQEEGSTMKKEFEEEQDRALRSLIEIFLLQRCVQDLEERNLFLSIHCQKILEASRSSEKLITEIEQKNFEQQEEVKFLSDQSTNLRMGMNQLLKCLNIVVDHGCGDKIGKDKESMSHILTRLEDIQNTMEKTQDENQHLAVEVSVLLTLLGQLRSEMEDLESDKLALDQEVRIRTKQILILESEIQKHIQVNEELRSKVREGDQKGELLTAQVENLQKKLLDMQEVHHILQKDNSVALEENWTLKKDLLVLEEKNCSLEEANFLVFGEMFSLSNLSLIIKDSVNEKIRELKELGEDVDKLHGVNCRLVEKLGFVEKKLEEVQVENLHLKHMLEKSEVEFKSVVTIRDQLNCDLANGKDLLSQKETELLEAEHKLCLMENEKLEFHKTVEDLNRKLNEIQLVSEAQERQILKLSEDNDHLSKENGSIGTANKQLMAELLHLHEEHEKAKNREEILLGNLHKERNEIAMCEMEAEAFFGELQMYTICQALFEEKFHELTRACESLENDSFSKHANIELLKGKVSNLEGENNGLKAWLAACGPAISSLRESIASLEKNTCLHTAVHAMKSEKVKDAQSLNNVVEMQGRQDQTGLVPDAVSDLQDLQSRVESIEQAVLELERLAMQENSDAHANLEAAMRQIEELKSKCSSRKEYVKRTSEISEAENGTLTKDIILDQISDCSPYGTSRGQNVQAENQMLELWETADADSSIDLTVGRSKKVTTASSDKNVECRPHEAVKKQKSRYASSDFLVEKEVGVDKLEISKRSAESYQEGSKRKVLERLNSDVQKLTNLQITVQDLKRKVVVTEKSRKGKAIIEFDSLKGQLEEADQAILKLFDYNGKMMKTIEDNSLWFDGNFALESEESENTKRRKISEQARRLSERIGRLQLEVQRIQFVLLKHDDEKESRGKTRMAETRRVLLRDYLYGGARTSLRRKKAHFCACVQPPTKED